MYIISKNGFIITISVRKLHITILIIDFPYEINMLIFKIIKTIFQYLSSEFRRPEIKINR